MFQRRRDRRQARRHDRALSDLQASAARLASSVAEMIPAGHFLTTEQIDRAADRVGQDFLADARPAWLADGISPEIIETIGPIVLAAFTSEFKTQLRAAIPLQNIFIEGSA